MNCASVGEIGTSMASMYRTGKTNAAKDVHNHYNEYSEFHAREVEAHICAAFMEKMKMPKMDGNDNDNNNCGVYVLYNYIVYINIDQPKIDIPDDSVSKSLKGKWLHEVCSDFVKEYVFQSDKALEIVSKAAELEQNVKSPFKCRKEECNKQYLSHSTRVRFVF